MMRVYFFVTNIDIINNAQAAKKQFSYIMPHGDNNIIPFEALS